MLVDFDEVFKGNKTKNQYNRIIKRLTEEKSCSMCCNSKIEEGQEHGNVTYHTLCTVTNTIRDGENGENCPEWTMEKEEPDEETRKL